MILVLQQKQFLKRYPTETHKLYMLNTNRYTRHMDIADEVKIEFSVRSLKDPYATINVQSILSEAFPNLAYAETPFEVVAVAPKKTLFEKAFLLHEKFLNLNTGKIKIERLSRHLYDLVKLMNTEPGIEVLKDHEFYTTLLEHRKSFVMLGNVDYDTLHYSTLSFIPPDDVIEMFRQDYRAMQAVMIYGSSPDFDTIINELKILTGRFRLINEYHILENIIKDAALQIGNEKRFETEGATFSTTVNYHSDIHKPVGPSNKTISYKVEFIRKGNKWVFESIAINSL